MDLAQIRKNRGSSQEDLAKSIGISRAAYSNIEIQKRRPSVETAKRIAGALGFDWTEFFQDKSDEQEAV